MNIPSVPVGFNYSLALLEILRNQTYEEIAAYLGYESVGAIGKIINGAIPSHPVGEALFALYLDIFGKKPPMSQAQALGVATSHLHPSANLSTSVRIS